MSIERTMQQEAAHANALACEHFTAKGRLEAERELAQRHVAEVIEARLVGAMSAYDVARRAGWLRDDAPQTFEAAFALLDQLDEDEAGGFHHGSVSTTAATPGYAGAPRQDTFGADTPNTEPALSPFPRPVPAGDPASLGSSAGRVTLLRPGGKRSPLLRLVGEAT